MNDGGYSLHLANGQGCSLASAKELTQWLRELAAFFELPVGDFFPDFPRIIFTIQDSGASAGRPQPHVDVSTARNASLSTHDWAFCAFGPLRIWSHPGSEDVYVEIEPPQNGEALSPAPLMFTICFLCREALKKGGLAFHGALIELGGKGVILAAEGGTGKSTCCARLPSPWRAHCDDTTLVIQDAMRCYHGHPLPTWNDRLLRHLEKTWSIGCHVPVHHLFFLEQADADEVIPLGQGAAAARIVDSAQQAFFAGYGDDAHKTAMLRRVLFENACALAQAVPSHVLRVSLTGRFWEKIEALL